VKRLIAASILALFIAIVYFIGNYNIKNTLKESRNLVEECVNDYKSKQNADSSAKKLSKFWSEKEGLMSLFAHHSDIDEVELAIESLVTYAASDNSDIFFEYSGTVKTLLHQLYEDASISIHSIF